MNQSYQKECLLWYECMPEIPIPPDDPHGDIISMAKLYLWRGSTFYWKKKNCKGLKLWLIKNRHKVVMLKGFEGRIQVNSINQIKERCWRFPVSQRNRPRHLCAKRSVVQALGNGRWRLCIASTLIRTASSVICLQRRIVFWQTLTTWASGENGLSWRYSLSSTSRHVRRTWSTWLRMLAERSAIFNMVKKEPSEVRDHEKQDYFSVVS